ncbi:ATP-dependent zinc metalloprotease FtsH [Lentisphaerota bacterium WC36G]|nr:ATP-dependent zinc metalloprotease FtsH [Lentisphaerae bacterium WC36]
MENKEKNKLPQSFKGKAFSPAVIIWMIVLSLFFVMLFNRSVDIFGSTKKFSGTEFVEKFKAGLIKTAEVNNIEANMMSISGKYYYLPKENMKLETKDQKTISSEEKTQKKAAEIKKIVISAESYKLGNYYTTIGKSNESDALLNNIHNIKTIMGKSPVVTFQQKGTFSKILISILPFILLLIVLYFIFSRQLKSAGKGAMQFGKSRARMVLPEDLNIKFDDVAGADEAKDDVKEIVDFLKDPLKYQMLGGKIPKGALLTGPPGTGKTLLAKAVACEAGVPFFSISGSDFMEMFVGVGASRVRDMFEQARKHSPCLIFIDEIDAVGRSRFSGMGGGNDEREQTLNAMLVEMDGLETQSGVIVLAATNRPDVLDQALLRPGRFDRQLVLDLPDIRGRKKILEVHTAKIRADKNVNLDLIARGTPGFSGADLANLVNEAALGAAREERDAAIMADFEEARDKVCWGKERRSRKISERERKLTAYHEAGHALVSLHCEFADPLHKVTIIPRGQALGVTLTLPEEEVYTKSKQQYLDQLAVLMGGRVAEDIVFSDVTSGASSDIDHASRIARSMVCLFGMNEKIGPIKYRIQSENPYSTKHGEGMDSCSQETAREIDIEVKKLVEYGQNRAKEILTTYRHQLEALSLELLEKETMDVKEVKTLLDMPYEEIDVNFKIDPDEETEAPAEEKSFTVNSVDIPVQDKSSEELSSEDSENENKSNDRTIF